MLCWGHNSYHNLLLHSNQVQIVLTHAAAFTPKLNATNSVSIPVSRGYANGKIGYFIATDASDPQIAASITNSTGFKVNFSPTLALSPESSRQQGYDFINGIKQSSYPMGFQSGVQAHRLEKKGIVH